MSSAKKAVKKPFKSAAKALGKAGTQLNDVVDTGSRQIGNELDRTWVNINSGYEKLEDLTKGKNAPDAPVQEIDVIKTPADTSASASTTTASQDKKDAIASSLKDKSKVKKTSLGGYKSKSGVSGTEDSTGLGFKKKKATAKKTSGLGI